MICYLVVSNDAIFFITMSDSLVQYVGPGLWYVLQMHYILYLIWSECIGALAQEPDHVLTMLWALTGCFWNCKVYAAANYRFYSNAATFAGTWDSFKCSICIVTGYTSNKNVNIVTLSAMLELLIAMVKGHHMSTLEVLWLKLTVCEILLLFIDLVLSLI